MVLEKQIVMYTLIQESDLGEELLNLSRNNYHWKHEPILLGLKKVQAITSSMIGPNQSSSPNPSSSKN
jgi:hypothetical protein